LKIYTLVNPPIDSNTYVLYLTDAKNAIIIDPFNAKMVIEFINKNDLFVDYIIFTHEHYDHIAGGNGLRNEYGFRYKLITSRRIHR
jgi:hydroxyacylglutathione hydrolase